MSSYTFSGSSCSVSGANITCDLQINTHLSFHCHPGTKQSKKILVNAVWCSSRSTAVCHVFTVELIPCHHFAAKFTGSMGNPCKVILMQSL